MKRIKALLWNIIWVIALFTTPKRRKVSRWIKADWRGPPGD
jgi:hypothetical protein